MTDPTRLIDERNLGATLLASAACDAPGLGARHRVAAALGLAASVATLTAASSAAGSMSGVGAPAGVKLGAGAVGDRAARLTLLGGGVVALAMAGSLIFITGGVPAKRPATATSAATLAAAVRAPNAEPEPAPGREPSSAAIARPEPPQNGTDPHRGRGPRSAADPSAASALARELKSLDAARSALDRRAIGDAFGALDSYDRTFPNGTLRTEASLLRVEALLARGDRTEARALARDLLARDPSGPQVRRLRSTVEIIDQNPPSTPSGTR